MSEEILSIRKSLNDWKNYIIGFDDVIKQIREFGIVYSEM